MLGVSSKATRCVCVASSSSFLIIISLGFVSLWPYLYRIRGGQNCSDQFMFDVLISDHLSYLNQPCCCGDG